MTTSLQPVAAAWAATDPSPPADFADAMSALASGVVLVTCRLDGRPWGLTVTAFTSVSVDPPTVLVSLGTASASLRAIRDTRSFGVSILAEEQLHVARYASAPGEAKFLEPFVEPDDVRRTSPAVAGALAHLDCELAETVPIADHTLVVGRVRAAASSRLGPSLVYHRRAYSRLVSPATWTPPTGRRAGCLSS
jgi:flavin reductase (DIM6/NTAB) family NADH-FMN oxidoreductase RutF